CHPEGRGVGKHHRAAGGHEAEPQLARRLKPTMWSSVMLTSTGRSPRGGGVTRPLMAWRAKRATVAIAERSVTAQSGESVASTTLFTGQVKPQASTTVTRARRP